MQLNVLQSLVKRDPLTYREEFVIQSNCLKSELELLLLKPSKESTRLCELIEFISHTSTSYKDEGSIFMTTLLNLLETKADSMHPTVRLKVFQALAIVNKHIQPTSQQEQAPGAVDKSSTAVLLLLSFKLLAIHDKLFRAYIIEFIIGEIKILTKQRSYFTIKNRLQSFLHSIISDHTSPVAHRCIEIIGQFYRKRLWTDSRTVNIIAFGCYNSESKVRYTAINFFLGIQAQISFDEEEEENKVKKLEVNMHEHSKKTRKRARLVEKQKAQVSKRLNATTKTKSTQAMPLIPAIMLINNPHDLAEYLFKKLKQGGDSFEQKLVLMNFLSQLIGCHKLLLLNFYSFVQKYLTAHTTNVTSILTYLVQACHEIVPPSEVLPVVKCISFNFISDRSTEESMAVGLNTIREIFVRMPTILLEPDMDDVIQDLVQYAYKNKKYVMAAAKGLINLVREQYPALLKKGDRGKDHVVGAVRLHTEEDLKKASAKDDDEDDINEDDWEEAEDDEGDDGEDGWEEVEDDEDDNQVNGDDDRGQ